MQAVDIREKLHEYVDSSDEKLLKLMLALAKEYYEEDEIDASEISLLDARRQSRLSGESNLHTWDEVKKTITSKNSR
jgi:hypothetical protein